MPTVFINLYRELSPTTICGEFPGVGGMNGHDYAFVFIAMELSGNHFEGTATVLSNNEEVIDAITLLNILLPYTLCSSASSLY